METYVLDDYTVNRVMRFIPTWRGCLFYEEQLSRWKNLNLTPSQRQEVATGFQDNGSAIKERITDILALAAELKTGTIDTILAKSDLRSGLNGFSEGGSWSLRR